MALKESKTRITVNIDKKKYEKVKEVAEFEEISVSSYINRLLSKGIEEYENKKTRD